MCIRDRLCTVARVADAVTAEAPPTTTAVVDPFVQPTPQELQEPDADPSFEELGVDDRLIVRLLCPGCAQNGNVRLSLSRLCFMQVTLPKQGIDTPSDIQMQAIPRILAGDTLAIQSFTGSGKVSVHLPPKKTAPWGGCTACIQAHSI